VRDGELVCAVTVSATTSRCTAKLADAPSDVCVEMRSVAANEHGNPEVRLAIDGTPVGTTEIARWPASPDSKDRLRVGFDAGFPVCDDYAVPAEWPGEIGPVTIDELGSAVEITFHPVRSEPRAPSSRGRRPAIGRSPGAPGMRRTTFTDTERVRPGIPSTPVTSRRSRCSGV
jgi:hypothetical protein